MKKLYFTVLMLMTLTSAIAQINVHDTFANDLIIIGNISSGRALNLIGGSSSTKLAEHRLYCRIFRETTTYGILIPKIDLMMILNLLLAQV